MSRYYHPVCAGYTANDEKIILYQDDQKRNHIQLPNGELWALGPKYIIETIFDMVKAEFHVKVESPQWTGVFIGTVEDLFDAEPR